MDGGGRGGGRAAEAERWLSIAGKLLEARDLVGSKRFAENAMDADPLIDGADQILSAAEVLLASQRRINNHLDWYSILQLHPSPSTDGPDFPAVKRAYRRLALLLHPDRNASPAASQAFKLVSDAWAFLSHPTKKRLYDDEIKIAAAHLGANGSDRTTASPQHPPPPASFWTMCSGCFRAYEYGKEYLGKNLKCQHCRKPFQAIELPTVPPVVPGTDMYYCSWGLFPLGFPGAPVFNGVSIPEGTLCIPAFPGNSSQTGDQSGRNTQEEAVNKSGGRQRVTRTPPVGVRTSGRKPKKVLASKPKKVLASKPKKQVGAPPPQQEMLFGGEAEIDLELRDEGVAEAQNVNDKVGCSENAGDFGGGFDINSFSIDLDATTDVLGNLANLPFLKDDGIVIMR